MSDAPAPAAAAGNGAAAPSITAPSSSSSSSAASAPSSGSVTVPKSSLDFFAQAAPKLHGYVRELQRENEALRAQNASLRAEAEILDGVSDFLAEMSKSELNYREFMALKNREVEEAKAKAAHAKEKAAIEAPTEPLPPLKDVPAPAAAAAAAAAVPNVATAAATAKAKPASAGPVAAAAAPAAGGMFGGIRGGFFGGGPAKPAAAKPAAEHVSAKAAPATPASAAASSAAHADASAAMPSIPAPAAAAAAAAAASSAESASAGAPAPVRGPRVKISQKRPPPPLAGSGARWTFTAATGTNPALRHLTPYEHEFGVFAKKRWVGRSVLHVLCSDFKLPAAAGDAAGQASNAAAAAEAHYHRAISAGLVLVNDGPVSPDYLLRQGDHLRQRVHRHEPPVLDADPSTHLVHVVASTAELLAVDKPAGVPVHESGKYRHQSLLGLLHNQPPAAHTQLFPVHRLDKLTSGLVILARTSQAAGRMARLIKLKGEEADDTESAATDADDAAAASSAASADDPSARSPSPSPSGSDAVSAALSAASRSVTKIYLARVRGRFPSDPSSLAGSLPAASVAPDGRLVVSAPLRVVSQYKGIHAVDLDRGKSAVTLFRLVSYSSASDTSVVEAQPLTGRTHQIRLHLAHAGHPIANDPIYGPGLFRGNSYASLAAHPDQDVARRAHGAWQSGCEDCSTQLYYNPAAEGAEGVRYGTHIYLHALSYSYMPPSPTAEAAAGAPAVTAAAAAAAGAAAQAPFESGFSFATAPPAWAAPDYDVNAALGPLVKSSPRASDLLQQQQQEQQQQERDARGACVSADFSAGSSAPATSAASDVSSPSVSPAVPSSLRIRSSVDGDIDAIASIYASHVRDGTGTFEESPPPSPAEMTSRRAEVLARGLPFLVAVVRDESTGEEAVAGFAYANWFRARSAYRHTLEDSVYVRADLCGSGRRGIGRGLVEALTALVERAGYTQLLAVIGDSANAASIALHQRCGFVHVGTMRDVGVKFGRCLDVVIMQKSLGEGKRTTAGDAAVVPQQPPRPCDAL